MANILFPQHQQEYHMCYCMMISHNMVPIGCGFILYMGLFFCILELTRIYSRFDIYVVLCSLICNNNFSGEPNLGLPINGCTRWWNIKRKNDTCICMLNSWIISHLNRSHFPFYLSLIVWGQGRLLT